jgi:hypothetical protein
MMEILIPQKYYEEFKHQLVNHPKVISGYLDKKHLEELLPALVEVIGEKV